ncbi:SGNH/GDSL hydrolase family protein [Rhodopseudomonas palustris]|uniref:SGNH/GDSL hydrolase family protein n=1 Tax=Rhodopseudomonas palustris TaxID=1076 RepID=UPI000642623C|nr:SGNH family hydrolase [Rhodopseudomonas palustris]
MSDKPRSFFGVFTERGPLAVLAVAGVLLFGIAAPASAQFFDFGGGPPQRQQRGGGGGGGFGWFGNDVFQPFHQNQPQRRAAPREDYSKAPAPEKRETIPDRTVLVLGDSMADWLGYGLEQAYAEQPEMGVVRKFRTISGLLRYAPKGEPSDWVGAAKEVIAQENPDAIVVMLGLSDRIAIREQATPDKDKKKDDKAAKPGEEAKPDDKAADNAADDDEDDDDSLRIMTEKGKRAASGVAQFREDRWSELYAKKIEDLINVLKAKNVPILWVGLPAVRGTKATSDMQFLNALFRDGAAKAGITYVDVWDGFVDEGGRYVLQGPDFEGQIRRLRSYDGVYFTKSGARKLAHYVEREIARLLAAHSGPIALPTEPAAPEEAKPPSGPAPRPAAGPILPLVASSVSTDRLLGGPGTQPAPVDALVARTLVKGEPLSAPAGRADDDVWPRREVSIEKAQEPPPPKEQPKPEVPVASAKPSGGAPSAAAGSQPQQQQQQRRVARSAPPPPPPTASGFFGFGAPPPQQQQGRRAPPPSASGFFSIFR